MNTIMKTPGSTLVTMTSLELVDFINSQRKEGEAELRHDHFMAKVPKVLGVEAAPEFLGTAFYTNGTGAQVERKIYRFPKREACLMAMSYSYELQAKVFDRMTALEAQHPTVPQTFAQALRLAAEQQEEIERQQLALEQAKPKVLYADTMMNADGTVLVRDAAKTIGVPVRKLETALREKGVILQNNAPAAAYVSKGYFKESLHHYETKTRGVQVSSVARVTGKGLEFLRRFAERHAHLFAPNPRKAHQ
ncbi:phage antirepressor KilAC domain-containing protein [Delftia acidovorans]|uniref:phage antirepressor KilAC domain-containing protein n=1 Tax=Delftia acidovorans TaxID=80866 RepID=UPI0028EBC591|nr:phage antirepressor KilAC domain-containing protein [Delftia acidovorans]